jgi:solute carrier family 50 protein (sugar transporter)
MQGRVIRSKSVECMPFYLSLSLFLCGGVWFAYGILMKDVFLEVKSMIDPNS